MHAKCAKSFSGPPTEFQRIPGVRSGCLNLCVNVLIHGHLCVCGFGRCRRIAHRYTFICQESVRNRGHGLPEITGMVAPAFRPSNQSSGRDDPDQFGGISLMCIHRSHLCHIGGADQGHFFQPPRNSRRPRIIDSDADQANDCLRRMAILAVSEGGLPACRKTTRTAGQPTTTLQFPNPPRLQRTRREVGDASPKCRLPQRKPSPESTPKAGRTGAMVGDAYPSCRQPQRRPPPAASAPTQEERAGCFAKSSSSVLTSSLKPNLATVILSNLSLKSPPGSFLVSLLHP